MYRSNPSIHFEVYTYVCTRYMYYMYTWKYIFLLESAVALTHRTHLISRARLAAADSLSLSTRRNLSALVLAANACCRKHSARLTNNIHGTA